jgi:hypothetical protein
MLRHHPRESSDTVIRPLCPKCQILMMMVGVELSFAGPDLRSFECPQCELDYKALAEDPMNLTKRWAGLKANYGRQSKLPHAVDTPARRARHIEFSKVT